MGIKANHALLAEFRKRADDSEEEPLEVHVFIEGGLIVRGILITEGRFLELAGLEPVEGKYNYLNDAIDSFKEGREQTDMNLLHLKDAHVVKETSTYLGLIRLRESAVLSVSVRPFSEKVDPQDQVLVY